MRAARYFAAVDSHTEGMPTRVITGGVGPIPGATMLERKLHFEEHLDELRLLLMREPRGHGAMSGAILQPPARPDADWGVIYIEVSGLLPMCGHGTIGVATVLVETGHGRGDRARDRDPARRARRPRRGARRRSSTAARSAVTIRNVPSFLHEPDRTVDVPGLGDDHLRHGLRRQLLRAHAGGRRGPGRRSRAQRRADRGRPGDDGRDQRAGPPGAPGGPAHRRLPPRRLPRAGPRRRRRRRRHLDPPRLAGPLAVRDGHERAHGAAARARGAGLGRRRSSTSP